MGRITAVWLPGCSSIEQFQNGCPGPRRDISLVNSAHIAGYFPTGLPVEGLYGVLILEHPFQPVLIPPFFRVTDRDGGLFNHMWHILAAYLSPMFCKDSCPWPLEKHISKNSY